MGRDEIYYSFVCLIKISKIHAVIPIGRDVHKVSCEQCYGKEFVIAWKRRMKASRLNVAPWSIIACLKTFNVGHYKDC